MNRFERDYKKLLSDVFDNGEAIATRTNVKAITDFNKVLNIDLSDGFPLVTGKEMFFEKAYHEYIWFRDGMVTTKYLKEHNINWWNQYADAKGYLGKTYGYQLRSFGDGDNNFDQLMYCISEIRLGSRRAHITLWNPEDMSKMALPVCYTGFTFVRVNNTLHMSMQFRSSDMFLGLPYDIAVGALLLIDVARFCELKPGKLGINLANAHIYENHKHQVTEYLSSQIYDLPKFNDKFKETKNKLINYKHGDFIKAPLNN